MRPAHSERDVVLRDILKVLNSNCPLDETIHHIISQACRLLGTGTGALLRLDPDSQLLRFQAALGLPDEYVAAMTIPVGQGVVGRAVELRKPVAMEEQAQFASPHRNIADPERLALALPILERYRALLAVPLQTKDEVYGGIVLYYETPQSFSEEDVNLAVSFADQAALAIENARLFAAEQRRAEQFKLISELGRRITAILTIDELLAQTVQLIHERFGYYHVHIGLVDGPDIVFRAEAGVFRDEPRCTGCSGRRYRIGCDGVSGHVAQTGEPLLIRDIRSDARYIRLDPGASGAALVLPLKVKRGILGVLCVESELVNGFDDTDLAVMQSLSNLIAGAIENVRLYERAQQLAALEERQKLARELHDSVSQALYGIALGVRTARAYLERDPQRALEPLDYVMSLADAGLTEMRALIFELRPESLETEGLVTALGKQAAALRARNNLRVETALGQEPRLSIDTKQALYRIAQEALHNAVKHARATRLDVRMAQDKYGLILEIVDDGIGFDTTRSFPGHLGLHSMQERATQMGAHLQVESRPDAGTRVQVRLPPAP